MFSNWPSSLSRVSNLLNLLISSLVAEEADTGSSVLVSVVRILFVISYLYMCGLINF